MTRKILAMSLIHERNMEVARDGLYSPNLASLLAKLWEKWEPPMLVLLSLILQAILLLLGNQRQRTKNIAIRIITWSNYMAADSVATLALGVISTNLQDALKIPGPLDATIELTTFWAPFLLLHLGGADTMTAFALQDTDLWLRHFTNLIVETALESYIFFRVMGRSRLPILSAMVLVAGVIKYAERTLSLWLASYARRRYQAQLVQSDDKRLENQPPHYDEYWLATKMFRRTECMFADAPLQDDFKSFSKIIDKMIDKSKDKKKDRSSVISKIIEMELQSMYENLYTKAKVTHSWLGFAFRFVSFLVIFITLISFSALHHRYNYTSFQLSVTFLLFLVAILLEGYAAFVFLTSCRTISWLGEKGINTATEAMKHLSSLRSPRWSNSMGQYSLVKCALQQEPKRRCSEVRKLMFIFIMKDEVLWYVYKRPVKDYVKQGIHQYLLNQAEEKQKQISKGKAEEKQRQISKGNAEERQIQISEDNGQHFSILTSKGRVPLKTWREQYCKDPATWVNVDEMEFGEVVIFWHIVTEICYYFDLDSLICDKDGSSQPSEVYWDWKISKYLSRYLMQLHVDPSSMLPPRQPLSKQELYMEIVENMKSIFEDFPDNHKTGETSNPEQAKHRRRRDKVQACKLFSEKIVKNGKSIQADDPSSRLPALTKLLGALLRDDGGPPANASSSKVLKLGTY